MEKKSNKPKYPGKRTTTNGNLLVSSVEALVAEAGVFYPITPSTEMGENFQNHFAKGHLNAFGENIMAVETEGEHAAQGGAIAMSVTGKRTVNFTSGQGIVYGLEQYYHAPGKLSTMVLEVGARALTKHALNVHCGHDDVYATMDTGWSICFAKDAQQAADQALILRKVNELALNPGINAQDGFLTTHLERTFLMPEPELVREFLGSPDDIIATPTAPQRELFGETRRRVPIMMDLKNPIILGPVQNQEHYMNGVAARRNNFSEYILGFFEEAYKEYGELTGRNYGLVSEYNTEEADTVFVALGSAAENVEAVADYLAKERGVKIGVVHVNVIRPFPEDAVIKALKGKKRVIILERTDETLSGANPLTRDVKTALNKAAENFYHKSHIRLGELDPATEMPRIFTGVYGLGSRDFRPEHVIGAYDYAHGRIGRQDGLKRDDGKSFFYLGIDHPYAVESNDKISGLPDDSIAVRFHSIGGWGMITTGKNLGMIIGEFSNYVAERDGLIGEDGLPKEMISVSANPKYGSEKKGAPTNYFLVAAPERIRVNCDLKHVDTVLCCDPKAFLHTNPLDGLKEGGAFVWETSEHDPHEAWKRIPKKFRQEIIDKNIRIYGLNGFEIAREATSREDLQTRMQGNSFLGAFFGVSPFLEKFNIPKDEFVETVEKQYEQKFGRFGEAVVASNMKVMTDGMDRVFEIKHGEVDDKDTSTFLGNVITPCEVELFNIPEEDHKEPLFQIENFDKEFRAGLGYDQPSTPLASVGMSAAGTGATTSKYVARREVPVYIAENCTQCMECIVACPDTALPNTAQDISTILRTTIRSYVTDEQVKEELLTKIPDLEVAIRADMLDKVSDKEDHTSFKEIVMAQIDGLGILEASSPSFKQMDVILDKLPLAYKNTRGIFSGKEKKDPGSGGVFGIWVSDLCKGCGACVTACGKHEALVMKPETEEIHTDYKSAMGFLDLLGNTPKKYLGLFDPENLEETKAAALKFHLMMRSHYEALVSGDGACAGCGEKSVLHAVTTLTEAMMRPLYHNKSDRFIEKANQLEKEGIKMFADLQKKDADSYEVLRRTILHLIMGYGAETKEHTESRIALEFKGDDSEIIKGLIAVLRQEAHNLKHLQAIEGRMPNGMSAMAMTAHTGCNTVYGSTPPNSPHTYPWMNSLFQDGATIGWLIGESFIYDHARRSVMPEHFADMIIEGVANFTEDDYFKYTHFTDMNMTDQEIIELPKVWAIGGDGGMGDIGFQNVSKVVMQNRPNVKVLLLDTQVYSNTGGQNSESSVMPGGFDMNQFGVATQGKHTERKSVAEAFSAGHGSAYIAQVSLANSGTLYRSLLDGLYYRGTAFYQTYTACMPEHGIPDYAAETQALKIRDSRGMPEFIFNPMNGETYYDALDIKSNQSFKTDWATKMAPVTKQKYTFTVAHWAFTEARFRFHHKVIKPEQAEGMIRLEDKIKLITMDDIIHRRHTDKNHRSYIENFGVYTVDYDDDGKEIYRALSTQMVLFVVERRKAWRLLQSRAGVQNQDYLDQRELLVKIDKGELSAEDALAEPALA